MASGRGKPGFDGGVAVDQGRFAGDIARCARPRQNASQPAAPTSEQLIAADNARLQRLLTDPAVTPEKRDDAARRLATRDRGKSILLATLRKAANPREVRLSAAKGATDLPTPNNEAVT